LAGALSRCFVILVLPLLASVLLIGCGEQNESHLLDSRKAQGGPDTAAGARQLKIPQREEDTFITDHARVGDSTLNLWDEAGGCRLEQGGSATVRESGKVWLKPMAPCYFIRSPGSDRVQVFQRDKTTRILAVVGTPVISKNRPRRRCGRQVQGVVVDGRGQVAASSTVLDGSIYCADQGLDNFQYSLFRRPDAP